MVVESQRVERGLAGGEQYLRRIVFEVKGDVPGLSTAIKLRWGQGEERGTFAKWDETPEPGEVNPLTGRWDLKPNVVPKPSSCRSSQESGTPCQS